MSDNVYGICPTCGEPGVSMAKNPVGPTICAKGHSHDHNRFRPPQPQRVSKDEFIKIMDEAGHSTAVFNAGDFVSTTTDLCWNIWQRGVQFGKDSK